MPSAQELWDTQMSWHHLHEIEKGLADVDQGEYVPQKVGKEYRITIDGEYIYFKRLKDAKEELTQRCTQ
jgi:hypothetical protein